ncbi:MAG: cation transporter [Candidatus Omnitrophica bacterium]|nr:cation transporter [Candidatus Omnitrophota bacterium]
MDQLPIYPNFGGVVGAEKERGGLAGRGLNLGVSIGHFPPAHAEPGKVEPPPAVHPSRLGGGFPWRTFFITKLDACPRDDPSLVFASERSQIIHIDSGATVAARPGILNLWVWKSAKDHPLSKQALAPLGAVQTDLNIRGAFLHMAADALVSLGVVAAGVLYLQFGWVWLDPVMSLVIALVIVLGTWGLLRQSLHLAFDGVPEGIDLLEVHDWLRSQPGVTGVHDLHVWALGTSEVALTAHLVMPAGHPGDAFFTELARVLAQRFRIHHPTIQIEIDGIDDGCPAPHVPG